jgi:hypothetical protein
MKMVHFISCIEIITNEMTTKLFIDHIFNNMASLKISFLIINIQL